MCLCHFYFAITDKKLSEEQKTVCEILSTFGQIENSELFNNTTDYFIQSFLRKSDCCIFLIGENIEGDVEKEFKYAVNSNKTILSFIKDGVNSSAANAKVKQFKVAAQKNSKVAENFSTKEELAQKVIKNVYEIVKGVKPCNGIGKYNNWEWFFIKAVVRKNAFPNSLIIKEIFDVMLEEQKQHIRSDTWAKIIESIFKLWEMDLGEVENVMKWLDKFFDYIQPENYSYMIRVLYELKSLMPCNEACEATVKVSKKIKPEMIVPEIMDDFLMLCYEVSKDKKSETKSILYSLAKQKEKDDLLDNQKEILEVILNIFVNGYENCKQNDLDKVEKWKIEHYGEKLNLGEMLK